MGNARLHTWRHAAQGRPVLLQRRELHTIRYDQTIGHTCVHVDERETTRFEATLNYLTAYTSDYIIFQCGRLVIVVCTHALLNKKKRRYIESQILVRRAIFLKLESSAAVDVEGYIRGATVSRALFIYCTIITE